MENASRALMMAAGVLIGILILSLAIYLFTNFGAASAEAHRRNEENQISQFNAQFTSYVGRTDITIHDIVTVINLARNNNETYELTAPTDTNYYITVYVDSRNINQTTSPEDLEVAINEELGKMKTYYTIEDGSPYQGLPTFSCSVNVNSNTRRVNFVRFTENK